MSVAQQEVNAAAIAAENALWVSALTAGTAERDAGVERLYPILVKFGFAEARRRGAGLQLESPELDDIAHQVAADATMTICRKVDTFRGDSRFTTWAYRLVARDVSAKNQPALLATLLSQRRPGQMGPATGGRRTGP